jgi:hyaluronan synthase
MSNNWMNRINLKSDAESPIPALLQVTASLCETEDMSQALNRKNWLIYTAIVASLMLFFWLTFFGNLFQPLLRAAEDVGASKFITRPSLLWASMGTLLLIFRTLLWFRYHPFESATMEAAPFLTVIIPAYNEGEMVELSIDSVACAHYPNDRLEIFVVDDGSRDDTWMYIQRAAEKYPGLVTTVRFSVNQGKRAALAEGFRRARGEVVVTIDSDSVIDESTLLAMAGPFRDPLVGAVAGKVAVYNKRQGIIPRMLHVRYILAFDFLRAVQSTYRTVYCCPGALAAYRTKIVTAVLDRWMEQTFLGAACTYGEDRSMTNFILAQGYDTVYQRTGVVHTVAPHTYGKLCKMFLRWDRSYIREELRFIRQVVWKRPLLPMLVALMDTVIVNMRYPVAYASLGLFVVLIFSHPVTILRVFFVIGLMSFLNMFYYLRSERSWNFVYGIVYSYFAFLGLFWIFPYALLTVRARGWLTR